MRKQRAAVNPPSTGYTRPTDRRFYVWQDRHIYYGGYRNYREGKWGLHPWRWMCTLCDPPSYGFQARAGAYQRIITSTMPTHFQRRQAHHRWAASRPAGRKP